MRRTRIIFMFVLVAGLSLGARNQDVRRVEALDGTPAVVRAAFVDSHGNKWFGTDQGLYRFDNLNWTYYTDDNHLAGNEVHALAFEATDSGDELWVGTSQGLSVLSFDADGVTGSASYSTEDGLLDLQVEDVALDSRGGKFIATAGGLNWFHDGTMDTMAYVDYYSYIFNGAIRSLHVFNDTLYLAQDGGIGRLVSEVDGVSGASKWDGTYGVSPFSTDIRSIHVRGEEMQYYGTGVGVETHTGYFAKEGWDLLSTESGLVSNEVISIAEDADGGLWFGTTGGLSYLQGSSWTSFTTEDGLLDNTVYDIAFDPDGSVWIATGAGVNRLQEGSFQDFLTAMDERMVPETVLHAWYAEGQSVLMVDYLLEDSSPVTARLFDMQGRLVQAWNALPSSPGKNHAELSPGSTLERSGTGIYVLQLMTGRGYSSTRVFISR